MPAIAPTRAQYAGLSFRCAVQFFRDADALFQARRFAGAIVACQHAWEAIGKAALALEAGAFSFPATRSSPAVWMRDHRVLRHIDKECSRLRIAGKRLRRTLEDLESWLPPAPHLVNPPINSEYFFDAGTKWSIPAAFFRRSHAGTAVMGITQALQMMKATFRIELRGISIKL